MALVGFADTTRALAPWGDTSVDIMSVNEGYNFSWLTRWTHWMQIHPKWDLTRDNNQNDPNHWQWLTRKSGTCLLCKGSKQAVKLGGTNEPIPCTGCNATGEYVVPESRMKDFPIFMQKEYPEVPGAVKYPLAEVIAALIPTMNTQQDYFTSSLAFMLGISYLMGYSRIELYGFELGNDSEYHYQRSNAEYIIGLLQGKGIEVFMPPACTVLTGPLYGYKNMKMGYRQNLEMRKHFLEAQVKREEARLSELIGESNLAKRVELPAEQIELIEKDQAGQLGLVNGVRYSIQENILTTKLYDSYFYAGTEGGEDGDDRPWNTPPNDELNRYVTVSYKRG
jgi:hypothetical protein